MLWRSTLKRAGPGDSGPFFKSRLLAGGFFAGLMLDKPYFWPHNLLMKPSQVLNMHRQAIRQIVQAHNATNARVFGSVSQGLDDASSDLDILVDPTPQTSLFDIGAMRRELKQLLGVKVDVLTPNALPDSFRSHVLSQAQPIWKIRSV
jgi:predicted nucleotidyltransferase